MIPGFKRIHVYLELKNNNNYNKMNTNSLSKLKNRKLNVLQNFYVVIPNHSFLSPRYNYYPKLVLFYSFTTHKYIPKICVIYFYLLLNF